MSVSASNDVDNTIDGGHGAGRARWRQDYKQLAAAFPGMRKRLIGIATLGIVGAVIEALIVVMIAAVGSLLVDGRASLTKPVFGVVITLTGTQLCLLLLAAAVVRAAVDLVVIEMRARSELDYETSARRRIIRLYLDAGWDLQSTERSGGLQALLVDFISHGRNLLQQLTATVIAAASLLIMLLASLAVGAVATLCALVLLGGVAMLLRTFVRRSRSASQANRDATVRFSNRINEGVSMALEIRTLGISEPIAQELGRDVDDLAASQYRASTASYRLTSVHTTLTYFAVGGGLLALVLLPVGNPQPYAAMILLLYRAMVYGRSVQSGYQNVSGAQPYLEALQSRLDEYASAKEDRGSDAPATVDDLVFDNVKFSYPGNALALDQVSFSISGREALGIVGPSGAGKSTVVQLLLGLRFPQSGSVKLGGVSMADVAPAALSRLVGYVPQDAHLFDATILENVVCYRPEITREDATRALEKAHVIDEVLAMPNGLDSPVGVGGNQLSGGQRQRVCIARALAGSPSFLVLDEPTSALDLESEEVIRQTLEDLRGEMGLVIIAHRMSTLRVCDRVLVLKGGRVDAIGARADLEHRSEYYSEALRLAKLV